MKSILADLNDDLLSENNLADILKFLSVEMIGLPIPSKQLSLLPISTQLRSFSRLNLLENGDKSINKIKQQISSQRGNYDIIAVEPKTPALASFAVRNRRVDVIRINSNSKLKVFNTRFGRRLEEYQKLLELDISFFWESNLAKPARPLIRILKSFESCNFPIILTHKIINPLLLRSYRGLQALGRILGLPNKRTDAIALFNRIEHNRKKISGIVPLNGVEIEEW